MPQPRKPNHLKVIAGTDQPCRMAVDPVDLPLATQIPDPPNWLPNVHAVNEFKRLAPILFNTGLLTEAGEMALGHMCALHGKLVQLWSAGEAPTGHMMAQYRALVNDFGLTPVAQGKVRASGKDGEGNPYAARPKRPEAVPAPAKGSTSKKTTRKRPPKA